MENIISQKNLLRELSKTKSPYKKVILEKADSKLIQAICEAVYNILEGNIQLDSKSKQDLLKYKILLRKLVQKTSLKQKKKFLPCSLNHFIMSSQLCCTYLSSFSPPLSLLAQNTIHSLAAHC